MKDLDTMYTDATCYESEMPLSYGCEASVGRNREVI